jgi:hypothetical protein
VATFGFAAGVFKTLRPGIYQVDLARGFSEARFASDLEKLAFEVCYGVLTTRGSIPFDPDFGSLLPAAIGQFASNAEAEIRTFVASEIAHIEAMIKERQNATALPAAQRLKLLEALEIKVLPDDQAVEVLLSITNDLDETVGFSIPLTLEA